MPPNPRKRPADSQWRVYDSSKAIKTTGSSSPIPKILQSGRTFDGPVHAFPQFPQRTPDRSSDRGPVVPLHISGCSRPSASQVPQATLPRPPIAYKPAVCHRPHPDSRLCQDFHWVPYPIGLIPYASWHVLHNRRHTHSLSPLVCPVCLNSRNATPHKRKLFLVAERLSWEDDVVSVHEKDLNQELTWEVNYELGILDPCVEDPEQVPGGKQSQANKWHPYKNHYEMKRALDLILLSDNITEASWCLWIGMQMDVERLFGGTQDFNLPGSRIMHTKTTPQTPLQLGSGNYSHAQTPKEIEEIDLTLSPDRVAGKITTAPPVGIPTSPSSVPADLVSEEKSMAQRVSSPCTQPSSPTTATVPLEPQPYFNKDRCITSYKTLPEFYSLLDQIERTSLVGALFLEAYAENTHLDKCRDCWFKQHVVLEADD